GGKFIGILIAGSLLPFASEFRQTLFEVQVVTRKQKCGGIFRNYAGKVQLVYLTIGLLSYKN
ncbi:hypothetical protein FRX31_034018, partial [Thalictrum thalictroides]